MPKTVRLDEKQRAFCRNLVKGMTNNQALLAAGYKPGTAKGDHGAVMQRRPMIKRYLDGLRANQAERLHITMDTIIMDLLDDRTEERQKGNYASSALITMHIAKLLGFVSDKPQMDLTFISLPLNDGGTQTEMTIEEWQAKWSQNKKLIEH
jgi:hypothetical protein